MEELEVPNSSVRLQKETIILDYSMCWCAQSLPTLCDPMDWSPPGSSVHEIFQARILEWVIISFSRGSSPSVLSPKVSMHMETQTSFKSELKFLDFSHQKLPFLMAKHFTRTTARAYTAFWLTISYLLTDTTTNCLCLKTTTEIIQHSG